MTWLLWALLLFFSAVIVYDLLQRRRAVLRNFPLVGHLRYLLESLGPELRQYIVASNDSERPFSRDERQWIYASSKLEDNYFGFGTDNEIELASNYLIIKHSTFPLPDPHPGEPGYDPRHPLPCAKVLGGWRARAKAFRPESLVNTSAMSFGALSSVAVEAINRGCKLAGCLQNTGEGGISRHHQHGGELIWQIGTGYFGCRDEHGRFSLERFLDAVAASPVRAVEIKLSQGAKPGLGGVLPQAKITEEIARIRLISRDHDCLSPSAHTAFSDVDGLLDFVEGLADASGLPVGIKSAVGEEGFWRTLAVRIRETGRSVDFITIDGGEGGTGAAPLTFSDHVALPFKIGFARVYRIFAEAGLAEKIVFIGAGKLGLPEQALLALALGCDLVAVAREAMLAVGCIQAQRCHTGHCPTGVTTHNRWLMRGLDPALNAVRFANYVHTLRKELLSLSRACGVPHPAFITSDGIEILDGHFGARTAREVFGYESDWGRPEAVDLEAIGRRMQELAQGGALITPAHRGRGI